MPSSSDYVRDPRVDAYIAGLPEWQQGICRQLRDLVHAVDPEMSETVKRRDRPYFVLDGNVCALLAARDHVNLFLYDGAIVPDPAGIITGGHENKTARQIAYHRGETIAEATGRAAGVARRCSLAEAASYFQMVLIEVAVAALPT